LPGLCRSGGADARAGPADRGRHPDRSLVAHVLVARYTDHLPLYRQAQIMA
jgi:transposase